MERHSIENLFVDNLLKVRLTPNSSKDEIIGYDAEKKELKIKLNAQPEHGKANQSLVSFFKKQLKLDVQIVKGLRSRNKLLKLKK